MTEKTNASGKIRITPLYGGNSNTAMCSLLELSDSSRLIVDCGLSFPIDYDYLEETVANLKNQGGIDAILLSHADLAHVGALPIFAGRKGLHNIPVICTLPVHKFSQLVLYDFVLNQEMEGEGIDPKRYTLDDVDSVFKNVITLKYSQSHTISTSATQDLGVDGTLSKKQHPVTVEALPSGRTIGGTIWRIRCGPAEVLYSVDVNLRKETLLDAAPLDLLPNSPAVMICEATSASRAVAKKKKGEKDETTVMLNTIIETVRENGNVLIPCETAGRLLELLLCLNKYWVDNHYVGLYHLVLLSHMSMNIIEFAHYQLEWMSDSLTKPFYNGKNNPFDLTAIKCYHDLRHMEKECQGKPKVVIATDMSLSYGLSKELLLKWGGDKRCRVVFIDHDIPITQANYATYPTRTLAEELKKASLNPPLICSVNIPVRTPLQGQELEKFRQEQEKQKNLLEEELLRRKRKDEISRFTLTKEDIRDEDEDEDETVVPMDIAQSSSSSANDEANKNNDPNKKKAKGIFSYLDTNFKTFETNIIHFTMDEYGLSNDDLKFQDIGPPDHRLSSHNTATAALAAGTTTTTAPRSNSLNVNDDDRDGAISREEELQHELQQLIISMQETPTKLVARKQTVQFTCDFKSFNFTGKVTFKAMRDFIHHINPKRLVLLSGQVNDFQQFTEYYQSLPNGSNNSNGANTTNANAVTEVYHPNNGEAIEFEVFTQSLKLQIPKKFVPPMIKVIQTTSEDGGAAGGSVGGVGNPNAAFCTIALLKGHISTTETVSSDGVRLIRYVGEKRKREETQRTTASSSKALKSEPTAMDVSPIKQENGGPEAQEEEEEDAAPLIIPTAVKEEEPEEVKVEELLELPVDDTVGVVSFKEITLMHIKQQLDSIGMKTEFHVSASGRILVCNEQVMISTDSQNHFHIEGPPIKAFFDARRILYQQFAFL